MKDNLTVTTTYHSRPVPSLPSSTPYPVQNVWNNRCDWCRTVTDAVVCTLSVSPKTVNRI